MYVHADPHLYVGRIMAEMEGEVSAVFLWVCPWFVSVDGSFLFSNSVKLVSSHCLVSLSWEYLGKFFMHPGYLTSLGKYLVGHHGDKARQWEIVRVLFND